MPVSIFIAKKYIYIFYLLKIEVITITDPDEHHKRNKMNIVDELLSYQTLSLEHEWMVFWNNFFILFFLSKVDDITNTDQDEQISPTEQDEHRWQAS